jgi:hypothetical protein
VSIATTTDHVLLAARLELERTERERVFREVDQLITWGCDQVELVNLAGGGACPPVVADLVEHLQLLAGGPVARPASSSWEAHEELLHLAAVLLGLPELDDEEVS